MIIFYDKKTGYITGTIDGRINTPEELNMWVGDPKDTSRIVISWKPVMFFDKDNKKVDPIKERDKVFAAEFHPDHPQKELIQTFDNKKLEVLKYKVNLKTMKLELKD